MCKYQKYILWARFIIKTKGNKSVIKNNKKVIWGDNISNPQIIAIDK